MTKTFYTILKKRPMQHKIKLLAIVILTFGQTIIAQKIDQEPLPYEGEGSSLDEAMEDKGPV